MQPDYTLMQQLLSTSAPGLSPAVIHGALTGFICSGGDFQDDVFSDLLEQPLPATVQKLMEKLGEDTRSRLGAPDFGFQLLLPADEEALAERLRALASWCDWFSVGFAAGFLRPESDIDADLRELLGDFNQFADMDAFTGPADEEDEADYMELVEYVRMGVISMYQQLNPARSDPAAENTADDDGPLFADPEDRELH